MDVFNAVGSGDRNVRSSRLQLINLQLTMFITQAIQKPNTVAFCQKPDRISIQNSCKQCLSISLLFTAIKIK
jgi:hypothetical protein